MLISQSILEKTLDAALSSGADFADVFVEETYSSKLSVLNQKADQAIIGQIYGAGIRLIFGTDVIYVTTNDLSEAGLIKAALIAAKSRFSDKKFNKISLDNNMKYDSIHTFGQFPWEINRNKKMLWLYSMDQLSRARNSLLTQVEVALNEKFQKVQIANSHGLHKYDERAYSRINLDTYVENNGLKESAKDNMGLMGTSDQLERFNFQELANETVDRAVNLLTANYAPAGEMPVIIDNGFGGVILHEACGHGLETTAIAKGESVFCNKLNQKIGHECLTAIDDGTIANEWGSLNIDDEGRETQKTTLIENGVLKNYLVDYVGSLETGYLPTGSGRKESYKFAPASRMRNTFIAAGKDKFEDMVRDIDYGLYAKKLGGGSVSTGTGDYNFQVREGYIIRNGRIEEIEKSI